MAKYFTPRWVSWMVCIFFAIACDKNSAPPFIAAALILAAMGEKAGK